MLLNLPVSRATIYRRPQGWIPVGQAGRQGLTLNPTADLVLAALGNLNRQMAVPDVPGQWLIPEYRFWCDVLEVLVFSIHSL